MIYTAKGLIGILNNTPITITSNAITKWNLENTSIIQTINYTFKENLDNYDVQQKDERIFITDLENGDLFCLNDDLDIQKVMFEDHFKDRKVRTTYLFKNLNSEEIIVRTRDGNGFSLLNNNTLERKNYPSILVSKHMRPFSVMDSNLIAFYNTLYITNDSEEILYHYHYDGTKSEIGVYITADEKKITQFEAPEPIKCVNFFTNLIDEYNTKTYSNIKGCLVGDKIVLCYQHVLYVLDYEGKVLQRRPATENSRYWGLEKLNDNQVLIAELDPNDSDKMFVFEYDV